jgi:DNA-binding MarR family transcriptional regulator
MIKKSITLKKDEYYKKHLEVINPFLPVKLTKMEIVVLAAFMSLQGDLIAQDRFCTSGRKHVRDTLGLSPGGLGNYLDAFKKKGFIYANENGVIEILPILFANPEEQVYVFKITLDVTE